MNQYDKTIFTGNLDITPDGLEGLVTSAGLDFISLKVIYEVEHRPPPPTNRTLRGRLRITAPNGDELGRIYYRENKQSITVWLTYCDWENAGPEAATRAIIHGWNPHPEKAEFFEWLKKVLIAYPNVPEQAGGNEKRPIKPAAPGQAGGDGKIPPHPLKKRREKVLEMVKSGEYFNKDIAQSIGESVDVVKQDKLWLRKHSFLP